MLSRENLRVLIYGASTTYGGIQVLVVRFAEHLRASGVEFVVLTTPGSRLSSELHWADQVTAEDVESLRVSVTHVFVPHVTPLRLEFPWGKLGSAKIIFWAVHPIEVFFGLVPFGDRILSAFGQRARLLVEIFFRSHCRRLRAVMGVLRARRAIICMDGATRRGLTHFYGRNFLDVPVVPIPAPLGEGHNLHRRESGVLSVGYLGRMDRFKFSAIEPFLRDVRRQVGERIALRLVLISEGPLLGKLIGLCNRLGIRVVDCGFMPNASARRQIAENADLAICMGTSALDIAAAGCPTIIIDPSERRFLLQKPKYRFVHQIVDATLGEYRDSPGYIPGRYDVAEVLRVLDSDSALGAKGRTYVQKVHSPEVVFSSLVELMDSSNLTCSDIEPQATRVSCTYSVLTRRVRRMASVFIWLKRKPLPV